MSLRSCGLHMDLSRRFQTVDLDRARFDPRNELAAELDRVVERVEAANEKRIDAQSVVFEDRIGDLLGRSDETGRVAKGTGRACDRHPQALVMDVGLHGKVHQALAPHCRRVQSPLPAGSNLSCPSSLRGYGLPYPK